MKQKEFFELSKEVMPVLDKLTGIAEQYGTAENLINITLDASGYINFTVHNCGMSLSRMKKDDEVEVVIRKQLLEENGEENRYESV